MTVRAPVPYSWLSNLFICNLAEETGTAFIWSSTSSSEMATDTDKSGLELGKGLFDLPSFQLSKLEGDGPKDQRCTQPWCHILGNLSTSFFGHSGRFTEVRSVNFLRYAYAKFCLRFSQPFSSGAAGLAGLRGCSVTSEVGFDSGFVISDINSLCSHAFLIYKCLYSLFQRRTTLIVIC